MKLYPPSGFLPIGNVFRFGERTGAPLDAALRALYRYCEDMGVPILTHASHSNGFDKGYDDLAAPSGWEQVLREYGGLRCASGTSVTSTGWRRGTDAGPNSWPMRYLEPDRPARARVRGRRLLQVRLRHEVPAAVRQVPAGRPGPADCADPVHEKRRRRLMFGSDYWMNTLDGDYTRALSEFSAGIERQFGPEAPRALPRWERAALAGPHARAPWPGRRDRHRQYELPATGCLLRGPNLAGVAEIQIDEVVRSKSPHHQYRGSFDER